MLQRERERERERKREREKRGGGGRLHCRRSGRLFRNVVRFSKSVTAAVLRLCTTKVPQLLVRDVNIIVVIIIVVLSEGRWAVYN